MELTRENVKHIAELARLKLNDEEISRYQQELLKILKAFDRLSNVPVPAEIAGSARSGITATHAQGNDEALSRLRPDVVENNLPTRDFLAEAPDKDGVFVRVPAILEKST